MFQRLATLRSRAAAIAAGSAGLATACRKGSDEFDAEVDYIVIGAGSSGCAVAARLAERLPHAKTLLVEAGWHDDLPQIQTAKDYFGKVEAVFGSERDWAYCAEAQPELLGRALFWPRGKVVGGCSSFNTIGVPARRPQRLRRLCVDRASNMGPSQPQACRVLPTLDPRSSQGPRCSARSGARSPCANTSAERRRIQAPRLGQRCTATPGR